VGAAFLLCPFFPWERRPKNLAFPLVYARAPSICAAFFSSLWRVRLVFPFFGVDGEDFPSFWVNVALSMYFSFFPSFFSFPCHMTVCSPFREKKRSFPNLVMFRCEQGARFFFFPPFLICEKRPMMGSPLLFFPWRYGGRKGPFFSALFIFRLAVLHAS